jgi:hypothetical protein
MHAVGLPDQVNGWRIDLFPEARRFSHTRTDRRGPLHAARRFRSAVVSGLVIRAARD